MAIIEANELRVSYGSVRAVKDITFSVDEGAFFAFLGANGAGKSTTISCLTTLLRPTSGRIIVAGSELGRANDAIRRSIGVVFQSALLDPRLTVRENLELRARIHGLKAIDCQSRIEELSGLLAMSSFMDRQYRRLSGGQKRRADIARAMIHRPSLLFLDEPTAGLDPRSREQVWKAIADVRGHEGMTVFLTTHYMEETERADMVNVIERGQIIATGTPSHLRQKYSHGRLLLYVHNVPAVLSILNQSLPPGSVTAPRVPGDPIVASLQSTRQVKWVLPYVLEYIDDFEFKHGSMDDVFLALTDQRDDEGTEKGESRRSMRRKQRRQQRRQSEPGEKMHDSCASPRAVPASGCEA
ncbi:MAG: ABC transporter ATP-binding protein [Propionibacteriaceae bacterium]|jgi:multidrug/hemolysin transport system ATP-binding protein|nr:ABC transporter ATP-binding protein [Propionibacteriaceae bacterium]